MNRHRPVSLTKEAAKEALPLPDIDPMYVEDIPISEYERIREKNIKEKNAEFLPIFGKPLDESRGMFSELRRENSYISALNN